MTRILVVDDDAFFGQMLMDWLLEQGYAATRVTTAETALERVRVKEECPDIFLVDERLGTGLSGVELISQLREVAPESDAILFTGAGDPDIARRAYLAGAWRYLRRPFDPNELGYVLAALQEWRSAKAATSERDWLRVLNRIVERLQQTNTVEEVGQLLVQGGVELGFDRARFYQVRTIDGAPTIFGVCQSGVNPVLEFDRLTYPLEKTIYGKAAFQRKQPTFFRDRELGPNFLSALPHREGYPDSLGEWVILPLFSGEECFGFLNMDNCRKGRSIPAQQKDLLRLFAGQAVSALERALRYEQEQQERGLDEMVGRILARMGDPAQKESLERLLRALHDELTASTPAQNFIAVFKSRDTNGYYTRLHIEGGVERKPYWRPDSERGMIWYVLNYGAPLYLPQGTQKHRDEYGLKQVGARAARSWMAAVLRVGAEVTGALIAENDDHAGVFRPEDFDLLTGLTERLAGVIQTAWLHEQEKEYSHLLHRLQEASEKLPGFDEEKLWWTALTLCTADYAASFDRAMLFLAEEGGARLRGRMAVGHTRWEDAEADWEDDVRTDSNWEKFLEALQAGALKPTPLDSAVRDWVFAIRQGDAFSEVLSNNTIVILSKEDAQKYLPADFLARFGVADYCLLPVKAGEQMMGVVALDNIWEKDPNRLGVLDILGNLTNQAALLAENLRKSQALEDLIGVQHEVLVQSTVRPLQETLQRICDAARTIAGADLTAIYPLEDNGEDLRYDHRHTARVGRRNLSDSAVSHTPTGLSRYALLEAQEPIFIPDVDRDETLYCGERHGDAAIVKDEGIRATIAAPVFGRRTGAARAMFHIDYHTPRAFSEHDRRIVEAFAHLIATAISNWRDAQGLRDAREAQDRELSRLSEVLQSALAAESDERQIIQLLLEKIPGLFEQLRVTTGITLKEWERSGDDGEPIEMHRFIYPDKSGLTDRLIPASENTGINGRAMRTGELQNVPDVEKDDDYQPRSENSDTRSGLDVPILVDGQVVGALNIESSQPEAFTKYHEDMAQRFADIAALAIGNVRRQRNLETVLEAISAVSSPTNLLEVLNNIASVVRKAIPNLSMLVIWYLDPDTHQPRPGSYFGVSNAAMRRESPRKAGAVQKGLTLVEPYYQPDVASDFLFAGSSFVKNEGIRSTATFPLRVQNDTFGVMFFSYRESHTFTGEEKRLYPILAEVVASRINDALQLHQTERERERLRAIQKITEVISASASAEQVLASVRQTLESLYPRCAVYLALYYQRTGRLDLPPEIGAHTIRADDTPDCFSCQLAESSLRTGKIQVLSKRHTRGGDKFHPLKFTTRVSLGATLVAGGDSGNVRLLGVLVLESPHEDAFNEDDVEIIRNVVRQTSIAIERIEQEANERFQSNVIIRTFGATPIIHDINQYTGRILRRIERLQREPTLTGPSRQTLKELLEQTREMSNRVTAMDLRREELTAVALDAELPRWIEETLNERSVPVRFQLDLYPDIAVQAYPKALRRAFYDLTRNAMEAMGFKTEGQQLFVTTRPAPDPGQVEIRIHNNGPAIPPVVQSRLFNDVYSSKGEERGIGLLFVRAAIERMGGEVWLESSTEEEGTTFVMRLRMAKPRNGQQGELQ